MPKLCRGFKLPASHVIHTVGPVYDIDGNHEVNLKNAYKYVYCFLCTMPVIGWFYILSLICFSPEFVTGTAWKWPKRTTFNSLLFLPYHVVLMGKLALDINACGLCTCMSSRKILKSTYHIVHCAFWIKIRWETWLPGYESRLTEKVFCICGACPHAKFQPPIGTEAYSRDY